MKETLTQAITQCELKGIDEDKLLITGIVGSDGSTDRHGDRVNPKGWVLDNFLKNPVIMLNHEYHQLPIGKATNVSMRNGKLVFDVQFSKTLEVAKQAFNLVKEGIMKAWSVGFIPLEWGKTGDEYTINKQELLELSLVSIPANPNALLSYKKTLNTQQIDLIKAFEALLSKEVGDEAKQEKEAEEVIPAEEEKQKEQIKEQASEVMSKEEIIKLINDTIEAKMGEINKVNEELIVNNLQNIEEKEEKEDKQFLLLNALRGELQELNKSSGKTLKAFNELISSK